MTVLNDPRSEDAELLAAIDSSAEAYLRARGGLNVARARRTPGGDEPSAAEFDRVDWQKFAELGWLGVLAPTEHGGLGIQAAVRLARKMGRWLAPEPLTVTAGMMVTLLSRSNTAAAKGLLEAVLSGLRIVGVSLDLEDAMSGAEGGIRAEIAADGGLRLSGAAQWAVPFRPADGWIVAVLDTQGSPYLIQVPSDDPAVSVEALVEADGRCRARVVMDSLTVDARSMIDSGRGVLESVQHAALIGRILFAAELLGAAERVHGMTLEHLCQRRQFNRPIGSFQVLQHRCVDVRIQLDLADACLEEAAATFARDGAAQVTERSVIRAKLRAGRAAMDAALTAVHLHGAMGITDECDVGLYFKRILSLVPRLGSERSLQLRWMELAPEGTEHDADAPRWQSEFPKTADWEAMPDAQFRLMLRAFLANHYPAHLRHMPRRLHWDEIGDWYLCLSRQGWIAPAWPKQHGGMGLPPAKLIAWHEEFESWGVARTPDQGILMVGPVLMQFGSPVQQAHYLPRIVSGENVWCQGYSEPGAGSDLASLRTEAVLEGDHFVVSGQKIWTTLAQDATHIFMLVRTDKDAKPQAGISFLLCDLATPGITVRPIRDLAGHAEFCEVFFDCVHVPRENLVGQVNQGWTIAKALLGFERLHLGSPKQSQHALGHLRTLGQLGEQLQDAAFRASYAELALDVADLSSLYARYANYVKRGEQLPPSVSTLKIWATDTYQRIGLAIVRNAGSAGGLAGPVQTGDGVLHVLASLYNASAAKIYGGSNEIQRNILARTVLELPS